MSDAKKKVEPEGGEKRTTTRREWLIDIGKATAVAGIAGKSSMVDGAEPKFAPAAEAPALSSGLHRPSVGQLLAKPVWPDMKLPHLISDGMVLQRGKPLNLWGTAEPGERVRISFQNQNASVLAGNDGRWKVEIGPFESGGPYTLTIEGQNKLVVRDVLVGEVWVCGGQSNMGFALQFALNAPTEISTADDPSLRLFSVPITVTGKPQETVAGQWLQARPESVANFSAVGYYFGRQLRKLLNVPVGLICSAVGGTRAESWISHETLESDPDFREILEHGKAWLESTPKVIADYQAELDRWKRAAEQAESQGNPIPPFPTAPREPRGDAWERPSGLFNGMVAPLTNYRIAGVVWYQGENNVPRPMQYRKLFPAMIGDWRRAWNQGDFPFLFAQISYFISGDAQYDLNWNLLQEAQLKSLSVPNVAMVVTADTEDYPDVHPKNKQEVGYRLALAAQALAYRCDVPFSGPIYDSMSVEGATIRLRFTHVYHGLTVRKGKNTSLMQFRIAGKERKFETADAIIDGDTVVVSSPKVPEPLAVRYAFPYTPEANLYNYAGLPAPAFRTDDWPITVAGY